MDEPLAYRSLHLKTHTSVLISNTLKPSKNFILKRNKLLTKIKAPLFPKARKLLKNDSRTLKCQYVVYTDVF